MGGSVDDANRGSEGYGTRGAAAAVVPDKAARATPPARTVAAVEPAAPTPPPPAPTASPPAAVSGPPPVVLGAAPNRPSQWKLWGGLLRAMTSVADCLGDDVRFALKGYKYGGLGGCAVHCGIADPATRIPRMAQAVASGLAAEHPGAARHSATDAEALLRRAHGDTWMPTVRFLGWVLRKLWRHMFRRGLHIDPSFADTVRASVRAAKPGVAVVLVPTHKSHLDYLLLSYLCFGNDLPMPRIVSGDNLLKLPVIGPMLFRHTGALFIRRSNRRRHDADLYKAVLDTSVTALCTSGCILEFFIEGGRSRDGCIGEPRFGLLGSVAGLVRDGTLRDALLVPVAIDYDRVPEDCSYAAQLAGGEKRPETLGGLLEAARRLSGRNMGAAYVRAGCPISTAAVLADADAASHAGHGTPWTPERKARALAAVGDAVMRSLDAATAVAPTAFVAAALLSCPAPRCGRGWLARRVQWLMARAHELGAHVAGCDTARGAVDDAVEVLDLPVAPSPPAAVAGVAAARGGGDLLVPQDALARLRLRYCANQLVCVLAPQCVAATAFCSLRTELHGAPVPLSRVLGRCAFVATIINGEFPRSCDKHRAAAALGQLVARGTLRVTRVGGGNGGDGGDGGEPLICLGGDEGASAAFAPHPGSFPSPAPQQELDIFTRQIRHVVGAYWAVAAAASHAAAGTATEELVFRARKIVRNAGNGRVMRGSPLPTLSSAELVTVTTQTLRRATTWLAAPTGGGGNCCDEHHAQARAALVGKLLADCAVHD